MPVLDWEAPVRILLRPGSYTGQVNHVHILVNTCDLHLSTWCGSLCGAHTNGAEVSGSTPSWVLLVELQLFFSIALFHKH